MFIEAFAPPLWTPFASLGHMVWLSGSVDYIFAALPVIKVAHSRFRFSARSIFLCNSQFVDTSDVRACL